MDWIYIVLAVVVVFAAGYIAGYFTGRIIERNKEPDPLANLKLPKCKCKDVNQCDTWCHAKEMFRRYHE